MTDRELLERAAKAAGIDGQYESWTGMGFMEGIRRKGNPKEFKIWNPLMYDDQALRLAVNLRMSVEPWGSGASAVVSIDNRALVAEPHYGDDPGRATRRAIVRAAAAIAEGKA